MTRGNDNWKNLNDPFAPLGEGDVPAGPFDERADADALDALLERATRPPAGLALDRDRLRMRLRAAAAGRPRRRRWVFPLAGAGLAAAAAIVVAALLLVPPRRGPDGPPLAVGPDHATVVARVGMDDAASARRLIELPAEHPDTVRVIYPRQASRPPRPAPAAPAGPILLVHDAPISGTPHVNAAAFDDGQADALLTAF